jgi:hypothetical protein
VPHADSQTELKRDHSHAQRELKTDTSGMSDASRRMSPDTAGAATCLPPAGCDRPVQATCSCISSWPGGQNTSESSEGGNRTAGARASSRHLC